MPTGKALGAEYRRIGSTKKCGGCHLVKSVEDFSVHRKQPDGLESVCRICKGARKKERLRKQCEAFSASDLALWRQRERERKRQKQRRTKEYFLALRHKNVQRRLLEKVDCPGILYLLQCEGFLKIGYVKRNLVKRIQVAQIGCPFEITLVHSIAVRDCVGEETYWHIRFDEKRVRGEWFALTPADVKEFFRRAGKIDCG